MFQNEISIFCHFGRLIATTNSHEELIAIAQSISVYVRVSSVSIFLIETLTLPILSIPRTSTPSISKPHNAVNTKVANPGCNIQGSPSSFAK